jgi:regulator of protease activity HflC (stomatin/prohibitin superfamily)
LDAKGQAAAIRLVADAEKTKIELIAEAERMRIETIADAERARIEKIKSADMDTQFLTYKTLEALAEMANGNSSTIFVPTEAVSLISSVASLGKITENIKSSGIVVEENN